MDRFYIGETEDLDLRIHHHNTSFFKNSYTSVASDWVLFVSLECIDRGHARKVESFIKRMKSKKFIRSLRDSTKIQAAITAKFK